MRTTMAAAAALVATVGGVPRDGIAPVLGTEADRFSHGPNERTPLAEPGAAVPYDRRAAAELSK